MRILHLLDHSPPRASAYTQRTMAVLRQQRRLGWQTCHLTGPQQAAPTRRREHSGADHWHFFRTPPAAGRFERMAPAGTVHLLARRLHQVVLLTRPQLLHAHSPLENGLAALRVGRRHRLPVLFEAHAPSAFAASGAIWTAPPAAVDAGDAAVASAGALRCFAARALEAWTAARAGAVVTNSDGMRLRLQQGGVAARHITVVADGIEIGPLQRTARDRLMLGADAGAAALIGLAPQGPAAHVEASVELALAALGLLQHSHAGARLLVACEAGQLLPLHQRVARHGLAHLVTALVRRPGSEAGQQRFALAVGADPVAALHRLADIVVVAERPHAVAPASRQLLEAMARGCVIAASDTTAHRSVIEDGNSGVLFAPGHPAALCQALQQLLLGRSRWPAMAASARWFIEYHRNWERCVRRYAAVYEALLARRA
ncbi:glycosyltransferase [Massilia sp. PWRC2]|uniref:glycosyltransferase n=1 Tax=Massilia sp. PWRC2 TaxID=2804626 RepID=UPI003CF29E3E